MIRGFKSSRIREEFANFRSILRRRKPRSATFFPRRSVAQNSAGIRCANTPVNESDTKFMKPIPGTLQEGGASFDTTHWTLVLRARQSDPTETAREALSDFCEAYWPPLYTFLRLRGHASPEAQDLVQGFFAHLLEKNTLSRADQGERPASHISARLAAEFFVQRVRSSSQRSKEAAATKLYRSTSICPKRKHQ